jgi:GAF domain-containing protein
VDRLPDEQPGRPATRAGVYREEEATMSEIPIESYRSLFEVARQINPTAGVAVALSRIAESTASAMGCRACSIRLLSTVDQSLKVEAVFGLSDQYIQKGPVLVAKSAMDRQALQGNVVAIEDCLSDSRVQYPTEMAKEGIRSLLVAPLQGRGPALGVIRVYTAEVRHFDDGERAFLLLIAELAAIALENARTFETLRTEVHDLRRQLAELRQRLGLPRSTSGTSLV